MHVTLNHYELCPCTCTHYFINLASCPRVIILEHLLFFFSYSFDTLQFCPFCCSLLCFFSSFFCITFHDLSLTPFFQTLLDLFLRPSFLSPFVYASIPRKGGRMWRMPALPQYRQRCQPACALRPRDDRRGNHVPPCEDRSSSPCQRTCFLNFTCVLAFGVRGSLLSCLCLLQGRCAHYRRLAFSVAPWACAPHSVFDRRQRRVSHHLLLLRCRKIPFLAAWDCRSTVNKLFLFF